MKSVLQPYPSYKSSTLPWLGDIPEHWEVQRCKTLFSPIDIRSQTGSEELLTVSARHGVVPRATANVTMFKAESYVGHKLCWPGDLVINSLWAWAGGLGVSRHHGIISTAYGVFRPKPSINAQFIHLLVRSIPFQWELQVRSKGIWLSRLQLSDESFLNTPCPLPPLAEQEVIVRYLNYMSQRVRKYVNSKRRLIELLEEERQTVINDVATRGLNPSVHLESSDVEDLDDVPVHWQTVQLARIGRFSKGSGGTKEDEVSHGLPCIRYGDIYSRYKFHIDCSSSYIGHERACDYTQIKYGDILFTGSGESIEEIGKSVVNLLDEDAYCGGDVILFRFEVAVNPRFAGYALDCFQNACQKSRAGRGITVMHVYSTQLKYIHVALPPLHEQASIVEYLDEVTTDIDAALARTRRQIELVEEYLTRLIADVVTGRLDVREVAAQSSNISGVHDSAEQDAQLEISRAGDLDDLGEAIEEAAPARTIAVDADW